MNILSKKMWLIHQRQGKKLFFIPLVHWTINIKILVVRKLNSLVQKNY